MKVKNLFYCKSIEKIGGMEQFFIELGKKFGSKFDITVAFERADIAQLQKLEKYVECIQYKKGMKIECEKAFLNYRIDIIDDLICNDISVVVHAIYQSIKAKPPTHPRIKHYISVSEYAKKMLKEGFGIDSDVVYNPFTPEQKEDVLVLMSAIRMLDSVKGGKRILELIKHLDKYSLKNNKKYLYFIFTNGVDKEITSQNVCIMKPRNDVRSFMGLADYGVNLADDESYCYANVEFLEMWNKPIVTTPLEVANELKMDDRLIINYDMSNVDEVIDKMFKLKDVWDVNYKSPISLWDKYLAKGNQERVKNIVKKYLVETTENVLLGGGVYINEFNGKPDVYERTIVLEDRLDSLLGNNGYNKPMVKIIEEITTIEDKQEEIVEKPKKPRKKKNDSSISDSN